MDEVKEIARDHQKPFSWKKYIILYYIYSIYSVTTYKLRACPSGKPYTITLQLRKKRLINKQRELENYTVARSLQKSKRNFEGQES